jgi:hypothetical protein
MVDYRLRWFLRDLHALPGGGGPDRGHGESIDTSDAQNSISSNPKNFDLDKYQAERDTAAMTIVAKNMYDRRYARRQKIESVSNGHWNPQRSFLNNGRDPHAAWKKGRP